MQHSLHLQMLASLTFPFTQILGKYLTLVLERPSFESWLPHLAVETSISLCEKHVMRSLHYRVGQRDGPGSLTCPLPTIC